MRRELIFQHDGTPPHFSRQVREILHAHYPDRWMGQSGPIIWPVRSPDFNVLDYFIYIKNLVEHKRDSTEVEVREAIRAAFNTVTPEMAYRATRNITRRAELCLREEGKTLNNFCIKCKKSGLDLLGIPLKKNASCYLPQGGNDSALSFSCHKKNYFLIRACITRRFSCHKKNYFLIRVCITRRYCSCMHMQKNVILEKNNDVIFFFLSNNNYLYEEYILHYFCVITYTFTLHLSFT